jgi:hypothetical protein
MNPPLFLILSQMNLANTLPSYSFHIHFNIILHSVPGLTYGLSSLDSQIQAWRGVICITRPSHPPWFDYPDNICWRAKRALRHTICIGHQRINKFCSYCRVHDNLPVDFILYQLYSIHSPTSFCFKVHVYVVFSSLCTSPNRYLLSELYDQTSIRIVHFSHASYVPFSQSL